MQRAKLILEAICEASKTPAKGPVSITHLLLTPADVAVVTHMPALTRLVNEAAERGTKVTFTDFIAWFFEDGTPELSRDEVLLFDLGADVRTSNTVLDLLQVAQLVIGRNTGTRLPMSLVTMSNDEGGPLPESLLNAWTSRHRSDSIRSTSI